MVWCVAAAGSGAAIAGLFIKPINVESVGFRFQQRRRLVMKLPVREICAEMSSTQKICRDSGEEVSKAV